MRKYLLLTAFIGSFFLLAGTQVHAQVPGADELVHDVGRQRLAQTGMKFLSVSLSARAAAMANAVTAEDAGSAMSVFYNPATMGRLNKTTQASLGQVQWIGDITYNYAAAAYKPAGGAYGVFGLSIRSVDYGAFEKNITFNNDKGYLNLGTYKPSATSIGLTYSRIVTNLFSVGGTVKYARQSFGSSVTDYEDVNSLQQETFSKGTLAYDFGVLYRTGLEGLNFAMSVRNFSSEVTYVEQNFELPLTFSIGLSMNMMDLMSMNPEDHSLLVSVDAVRPRDYHEQLKVGAEYTFLNTVSLQAGYVGPTDERGLSLGAGLQAGFNTFDMKANYAYTQFGRFGAVNRLGLTLGL